MKFQRLLAPSLVLASLPFALALHPRFDAPSFEPAEGLRLAKELGVQLGFHVEDLSMSVNGQEMPPEMMGEALDQTILVDALMKVTDEFVASSGGKHVELLRTFDSLELEGGPENEEESFDGLDDFEGSTVRFKWNEEESDYAKTYADGEGDEEALSELSPDMDFLALLPDGEVEVGATWSATGEELATVFLPGGLFPMPEDADDGELAQVVEEELGTQLAEAFKDFEVRCTYAGSREEEGQKVGEIELEFEGKASIDLSDLLATIAELQAGEQEVDLEIDITASLDVEFKGEGKLLWNLGARHVHGFDMNSDMTLLADVEADVTAMGESQSVALSAELSGEGTWKLATSKPE